MKAKLLIICIVLGLTKMGHAQFTFGVSPGLSFNGAYFGYKLNKFVPFVGIQYFGGSLDYSYSYEEFDFGSNTIVERFYSTEGELNLFLPNIGVKYFFFENEKLKAHATLNLTKPIVSGSVEYDGDPDDYLDEIVEGLSVWGGELSFGTEYFFDEHFSIGGEFGLRYLNVVSDNERETTVYNPVLGTSVPSEIISSTKFNLKPTFSRLSVNFYF